MSGFQGLASTLKSISGQTAAELVGASADIALVIDAEGIIIDLSISTSSVSSDLGREWIGLSWQDTVTIESQQKVVDMLAADASGQARQRQVNHFTSDGTDLPVVYRCLPLNDDGDRVALGKDLSSLARVQQRLVNVQQSMDRDYARLRQYETRYRMLFHNSPEAILVVDLTNSRVTEVNPAACTLLGVTDRRLINSGVLRWFDADDRQQLEDALGAVRMNGQSVQVDLQVGDDGPGVQANLSLFKDDQQGYLLIRLQRDDALVSVEAPPEQAKRLNTLVESVPDALVMTDDTGSVLLANTRFLDIAQVATHEQLRHQPIANWLGQGGIDYQVIMSSLRKHGSIRLYTTQIRGEFGSVTDVEVSAAMVNSDDGECIGFSIRNVMRRLAANDAVATVAPRSVDQLTELVGRVPLKELVRESTELIEQLCIQAALKLTGNNRASAAEMLGLSRQSLYVKLRRYAMEDDEDGPVTDQRPVGRH